MNGTISKHRSETKNHWDTQQLQEELNKRSLSILPYVKGKIDRIGRILNKYNIRTIFKSPKKIEQILRNPKDFHSIPQEFIQNTLLSRESIHRWNQKNGQRAWRNINRKSGWNMLHNQHWQNLAELRQDIKYYSTKLLL